MKELLLVAILSIITSSSKGGGDTFFSEITADYHCLEGGGDT